MAALVVLLVGALVVFGPLVIPLLAELRGIETGCAGWANRRSRADG